ncbi:MAG: hypothetical protein IPK18_09615 [Sphingobacteriales bacterium]|nr:MAG: hypothetical protein IPK18_09615 [Sphingobacteriales bacterium]
MNTTNKTKGLMIAAIIAFAATIFTGCVVPTPGGGNIKNGKFTLNMKTNYPVLNQELFLSTVDKNIILYDGDRININLTSRLGTFGYRETVIGLTCFSIDGKGVQLEFLNYNNPYLSNNLILHDNISIDDNNIWATDDNWDENIISSNNTYFIYPSDLFEFTIQNKGYIVFRKKEAKGNEYIYFWIKYEDKAGIINGSYNVQANISNGKYQLNSITTGL